MLLFLAVVVGILLTLPSALASALKISIKFDSFFSLLRSGFNALFPPEVRIFSMRAFLSGSSTTSGGRRDPPEAPIMPGGGGGGGAGGPPLVGAEGPPPGGGGGGGEDQWREIITNLVGVSSANEGQGGVQALFIC